MNKKIIDPIPGLSAGMKAARIPISPVVRANGFLFLSGMPPLNLETGDVIQDADIKTQTKLCLEGIKHVLTHAGSSLDKIVSMRVYCSDPTQFKAVNEVYSDYFPEDPPSRTFIPVSSWQMGFEIELECVALE
ncbi:RidA family protein [Pusillimonas sp.]|uniref:RidA family protein n=1 Tax=Pusillimonas sp. TaxID=3040095 RepID=UPI0037CC1784